ncbi:hypothetical protein EGJ22_18655 [Pseudomonas sp. p99-361]|nr:hypothetical protein HV87_08705 [Pseudomonas aeruginosa]QEQ86175.1 hypothetical protein F1602_02110 [Pseudomonas putida]RRV13795.1 hypothetical protein EGJ22_18655 [Pseudomonas sp. p99-361]
MLKIVPDPPHTYHSLEDTLIQAAEYALSLWRCLGWPLRGQVRPNNRATLSNRYFCQYQNPCNGPE